MRAWLNCLLATRYALPFQGSVEPLDTAWAVRRWNPQDQGSFALALIHLEVRHPPNDIQLPPGNDGHHTFSR